MLYGLLRPHQTLVFSTLCSVDHLHCVAIEQCSSPTPPCYQNSPSVLLLSLLRLCPGWVERLFIRGLCEADAAALCSLWVVLHHCCSIYCNIAILKRARHTFKEEVKWLQTTLISSKIITILFFSKSVLSLYL